MVPLDTAVECCPSLELLELFDEIEGCHQMVLLDAVVGWLQMAPLELFDEIKGCRQMVSLDAVVGWLRWTLSLNVALRWSCWNYSKRSRAVVRWFCWALLLNGSAGRCR